MKKIILVIIFLFIVSLSHAQTKPHWLQLQGAPAIDIRSFGIKGDGTNEYSKLKAAFESGGLIVIPDGLTISIDGSSDGSDGISVSTSTMIIGIGSAKIRQMAAPEFTAQMLRFNVLDSDIHLKLEGLDIDGNNAAGMAIVIVLDASKSGGTIEVEGCDIKDLNAGSAVLDSSGIWVDGPFDNVSITKNVISDVTRTTHAASVGSRSATGIAVLKATNVVAITANTITNVLSNVGSSWRDADAIAVFAKDVTIDSDPVGTITVADNQVRNFSSRAVKLQTNAATVSGNTFRLDLATTTTNSYFVDAQYGSVAITNNKCYVASSTTVTLGGSFSFFQIAGRVSEREHHVISQNVCSTKQAIAYGIIYAIETDKTDRTISIESNQFIGPITNIVYVNSQVEPVFKTMVYVNGNLIKTTAASYLVWPVGLPFGTGTTSNNFYWYLTSNHISPLNNGEIMRYIDAAPLRGNVQIANNIGWKNPVIYVSPSIQRILPGSSFYFGSAYASCAFDVALQQSQAASGIATSAMIATNGFYIERNDKYVILSSGTSQLVGYIPSYEIGSLSWDWIISLP